MTEPDFSKMSTREILEWQYKNKPQIEEGCGLIGIEKQVWESTLNRSMVLEAENDKLKENIHSILFTDDVVQDRYDKAKAENDKLKTDCQTLAQKLLQAKPELREWLEVNYKEYL